MISIYLIKNYSNMLVTCNRPRLLLWLPTETTMRRRTTTFTVSLLAMLLFAAFSLQLSRSAISYSNLLHTTKLNTSSNNENKNAAVRSIVNHPTRRVSSVEVSLSPSTVSVLLPDWEILVIASRSSPLSSSPDGDHHCLFPNKLSSPAKYYGVLPFTNRTTFKCGFPEPIRRWRMLPQPVLVSGTSAIEPNDRAPPAPELLRWNFLVYDSFSTEDDVVLFAKGVNSRQGYDMSPEKLRCVFELGDGRGSIRSAVTSSVQEVFRCPRPDLNSDQGNRIGISISISLEIIGENTVLPSVAYYTPRPKPKPKSSAVALQEAQAQAHPKHSLCACTMVYNVAKFLREWVVYNSRVGVENFILYDNGSDDDLDGVVMKLRAEGYNITTLLWIWPKTQEAGFSHSVEYSKSKKLCNWIMYVDVDEFLYSPKWKQGHKIPTLKSMLPGDELQGIRVGQVSIRCLEFGPSGQRRHPAEGVTRGYTCRRRMQRRHKSIVRVEAVDRGLKNAVHHFKVKEGWKWKELKMEEGLVNHYKYQAWDEFKSKFRRRVSTYVVDWKENVNPNSNDRTPGLGFKAIEPQGWANKFCEVRDARLKNLTQAWL